MKIIIDSNSKFAKALATEIGGTAEPINHDLNELCETLKAKINLKTVFFINCELELPGHQRQDFVGVEILKWLRLKGVNNHCVMYSFLPLTAIIKRNPLKAILTSKGVTFVQCPFNPLAISSEAYKEQAERENLLPFFRGEIDLIKIRHELANIWGAERMNWLLRIPTKPIGTNYSIELLKFTSPLNQQLRPDIRDLNLLIENFTANGKKIFYYDDMSDMWRPALNHLFGGPNIEIIDSRITKYDELIDRIGKERPGCLLLDVRLENETDTREAEDYSGSKLLYQIKEKFFTLPVIMFTASNKAETVRALLKIGADYVWSKEGIDEGNNGIQTLKRAISLHAEVSRALTKFKNKTYEKLYGNEYNLSVVNNNLNQIKKSINKLKQYDCLYIDSNYFIESIKENYFLLFQSFLIVNRELRQVTVIIHDDVIREIFNISKQDENRDSQNKYRVPVCKFLLQVILKWIDESVVQTTDSFGQKETIKEVSRFSISNTLDLNTLTSSIDQRNQRLADLITNSEQSEQTKIEALKIIVKEANAHLLSIKGKTKSIPDLKRIALHADETFSILIEKALISASPLFISDDRNCTYEIGLRLQNDKVNKVKRIRNFGSNTIQKEAPSIVQRGNFKYTQMYNYEFNNLLKEIAGIKKTK